MQHRNYDRFRSSRSSRSSRDRDHSRSRGHVRRQEDAERSFLSKTSIDPSPRIRLEKGSSEWTVRAIDLLCPIGRGQRGLIVAPPGSGKTTYLKHICKAITAAEPEMKVYCLLIDERPEEVTDFRRSVSAEVWSSATDQTYENHIQTADQLMTKAFREADGGADVMILLDSLTRLTRVHNSETRGRGRTLSGGMDAEALAVPRRIFGSARKIEHGGSLGILATILIDTGSRLDEVIFQEFKGTGNMEIVLSRDVSSRRIFPAVHVAQTGTRKEELLFDKEEIEGARKLRAGLAGMDPVGAAKMLAGLMERYSTNREIFQVLSGEKPA